MIEIKSDPVRLHGCAPDVYKKLSNPENLAEVLARLRERKETEGMQIPDDMSRNLDNISVGPDSITMKGGPMGAITLRRGNCVPDKRIEYTGETTPVPMGVEFTLIPGDDRECEAVIAIKAEIPVFIRPMVSGPLKKGVEMFSSLMANVPSWK